MVWQETHDIAVIVMLTQTHDGDTEKCFQYFPLDAQAGPFTIEPIDNTGGSLEGSLTFSEHIPHPESKTDIRKLILKFGAETRDVWHFLFSGWPDFNVPKHDDLAALIELLKLSAEKNTSTTNPRIIHCSAGVGRSGTFIALEHLLAQIDSGAVAKANEEEDMIYDVVGRMREQRMMMVQMETQYQFLYDVIKEQYTRKTADFQRHGQPSPKLRKLADGVKAAWVEQDYADKELLDEREGQQTHQPHDEMNGPQEIDGSAKEVKYEGQTPKPQ